MITCQKYILFVFVFWACQNISAQTHCKSMSYGESITYETYFKWGLIMPRAGDAVISFNKDYTVKGADSRYRLLFRSTRFFDSFYKMRDTLSCYYNADNQIVFGSKRTDEGNYYSVDELTFTRNGDSTSVHSYRYTPRRVKVDTVMSGKGYVTDMLGAFYYVRGFDMSKLHIGDVFPLTVAIGKDMIKVSLDFKKRETIELGGYKFNTCYFHVNIYDDAFESTTTSAEVWISDDKNAIPVRIRTKLKVGYADVRYKESSGVAHEFNAVKGN
ncbi:MAG: DUF3108 domain-containing protein [Tannerella sp.]|nr:DUF3108 domain-containing protein [Tannerella sp.]